MATSSNQRECFTMNEIFVKKVCSGTVIFREGEKGECMYHLRSGKAGVYVRYGKRNEKLLTVISAEDANPYFGEMALVDSSPRSATVVALENCEVGEVPAHSLNFYFREHPQLILGMLRRMSDRLRNLTDDYMDACHVIAEQQAEKQPDSEMMKTIKKYTAIFDEDASGAQLVALDAPINQNKAPAAFSDTVSSKESVLEAKKFPAGTVIFKEGDVERLMYEVMSGQVAIVADHGLPTEKKLTVLSADSNRFLGEMGLIDNVARSATAVAETDCILLPIDIAQANAYFMDDPRLMLALMHQMSDRIRKMTTDYADAIKTIQANEKYKNDGSRPEWLTSNLKKFASLWADFGRR